MMRTLLQLVAALVVMASVAQCVDYRVHRVWRRVNETCRMHSDCMSDLCDFSDGDERAVCIHPASKKIGELCLHHVYCESHICDNTRAPGVCMAQHTRLEAEPCVDGRYCESRMCDITLKYPRCMKPYSKAVGESCFDDNYCQSDRCSDRFSDDPVCLPEEPGCFSASLIGWRMLSSCIFGK